MLLTLYTGFHFCPGSINTNKQNKFKSTSLMSHVLHFTPLRTGNLQKLYIIYNIYYNITIIRSWTAFNILKYFEWNIGLCAYYQMIFLISITAVILFHHLVLVRNYWVNFLNCLIKNYPNRIILPQCLSMVSRSNLPLVWSGLTTNIIKK